MESPTLSRSPSATFGPGSRGRRSQMNIQHLSLAPLTPKYPVDPSDYEAYLDPATSALHTSSASLTQIASLPSPGGILSSPARSRANSKSRLNKRKTKSTVSIKTPVPGTADGTTTPSGAFGGEGLAAHKSNNNSSNKLKIHTDASSWLVQTGLALTEGSREMKGQSWITKRDSSTSLHGAGEEYSRTSTDGRHRATTPRSRSRRRRSKRDLTMTPAAAGAHSEVDGGGGITSLDSAIDNDDDDRQSGENMVPDWADSQTQAEIAAQVENELAEEFDEMDRYGVLDFDTNFYSSDDEDDEEEVREAITKGKSWLDGVVEVFLKLEDDPPQEGRDGDDLEGQLGRRRGRTGSGSGSERDVIGLEPPPNAARGVWDDVAWFGRLLARTVRS